MSWQPIETAPMDGTPVALSRLCPVRKIHAHPTFGFWWQSPDFPRLSKWIGDMWWEGPTHWRRLPWFLEQEAKQNWAGTAGTPVPPNAWDA